jgi:fido (protein-threonine AMPylation protein)
MKSNPRDVEIALTMVRSAQELLPILLSGATLPSAAARLAGAFEFMGRAADAQIIVSAFASMPRGARATIRPANPFETDGPTLQFARERSPYALRIRSLWASWREAVIAAFPPAPGLSRNVDAYLGAIDEQYATDAYHSLSIEGYRVTDMLIQQVAAVAWNPEHNPAHAQTRDAMAARGYYQAFLAVKASIARILNGEPAADVLRAAHHSWYAQLFDPSVQAGVLDRSQLTGYRTGPIFIRNSLHTPIPREAILDSMETLFDLIAAEPQPCVRAVLGHHLFEFIHPYYDGNGRIGRFLMNALLASGGYPWTVIRVEQHKPYMQALEAASVNGQIEPLAQFIAQQMRAAKW